MAISYDDRVNARLPDPERFSPRQANIARVYDYLLGGKDNFAADRAVGDQIMASIPGVHAGVRAQRAVLGRAVRYLVRQAGIRQLIDIGAGLPTAENVHEIARRLDPAVRVAYIDNDPVVLAHARALLADDAQTIVIEGDLRDPAQVLETSELCGHLDRRQPVGVLLCGILHHIMDWENPGAAMHYLCQALPSGSYVFIHHLVKSDNPASAGLQAAMARGLGRVRFRTREEILSLFCGLDLVEPGLVPVSEWHPDPQTPHLADPVVGLALAGLARKP